MSLLGRLIESRQKKALEGATSVVGYWLSLARYCGEYGSNLETFTAHFHAKDNPEVWEALCELTDCFPEAKLAFEVGISVKYVQPDHAEVTYTGVQFQFQQP